MLEEGGAEVVDEVAAEVADEVLLEGAEDAVGAFVFEDGCDEGLVALALNFKPLKLPRPFTLFRVFKSFATGA